MDLKYLKNSHVLIDSHSGYLKVDSEHNIRRVCFLGRFWFLIKDWYSGGEESKRLNEAIKETLEVVKNEINSVKQELIKESEKLPDTNIILTFNDPCNQLNEDQQKSISKIFNQIQKLILKRKGSFLLFGIPDYSCKTECLNDLPIAIKKTFSSK